MATSTKDKGSSLLSSMEVEDHIDVPLRGRGYDPDTIAIREALEESLKDGNARSFSGVTRENREKFARPIRAAANMNGKDKIKVSTRFDEAKGKLYWGPDEVLKKLAGNGETQAEN